MCRSLSAKPRKSIVLATLVVRAHAVPSEKQPFSYTWPSRIAPLSTHGAAAGYKPPLLCVVLTSDPDFVVFARALHALDPTRSFGASVPPELKPPKVEIN